MIRIIIIALCVLAILACEYPTDFDRDKLNDPKTGANYIPTSPSDLIITMKSDIEVNLEWKINSIGESGFVIERRAEEDSVFSIIGSAGHGINKFTDSSGISTGKLYYYRVGAFAENNEVRYTAIESYKLVFEAPHSVNLETLDHDNVLITWEYDLDFHSGFHVKRKSHSETDFVTIGTTDASTFSFTDSDLQNSQLFNYKIVAYTDLNTSKPLLFNTIFGPLKTDFKYSFTLLPAQSVHETIFAVNSDLNYILTGPSFRMTSGPYIKPMIRDLNNGNIIHSFYNDEDFTSFRMKNNSSGTKVITQASGNSAAIWNMLDYSLINSTSSFGMPYSNAAISNDNQFFGVSTFNRVYLYDLNSFERLNTSQFYENGTGEYLTFTDDSSYLVSFFPHYIPSGGIYPERWRIDRFSIPDFTLTHSYITNISYVYGWEHAFHHNNDLVFMSFRDRFSILEYSSNIRYIRSFVRSPFWLQSSFINSESEFVFLSGSGDLFIYHIKGNVFHKLKKYNHGINRIHLTPNDSHLVIQFYNRLVHVYELSKYWTILDDDIIFD